MLQVNQVDFLPVSEYHAPMATSADKTTTIATLALCKFAGVGPRLFEALLTRYGSVDRILNVDSGSLMSISGMVPETADQVSQACLQLDEAEKYLDGLTKRDIQVVTRFAPQYPQLLFELNNPPTILYVRGQLPDQGLKTVTVAGAANATDEGIRISVELARRLTKADVQVVATLRSGVGASTHLGGKKGNAPTFAVIDSGIDHIH